MRRKRPPTLAEVYTQIPAVPCRGLCVDSCGPIAMSRDEDRRLRAQGIDVPPMADAIAVIERGGEYRCPALRDGRCGVYEDRPTICRLWGATESMPCPHGCRPERPLTQAESHHLLRVAAAAGGGMVDHFFLAPDEGDRSSGD